MKTRKALLTIELLLIIGVVVSGLAAAFVSYKNINTSMAQMKFSQDFRSVILNFELQKKKYNGLPSEDVGELLLDTPLYNKDEGILKHTTASSWAYHSISLTAPDNLNYSSGAILVKINEGNYEHIKDNFILSSFSKVCLNGKSDFALTNTHTIDRISDVNEWCLVDHNAKIFDTTQL